jgi:hypothetical protein
VAARNGIRYSMSGASPLFARLWPHYWPDGDAPRIHRTTASAVLSAVALQADLWNPVPTADTGPVHPATPEHDPDSPLTGFPSRVDDTDPPSPDDGRHRHPDPHGADPAALRRPLHQRSRMYRTALDALGASYGVHSLAPDLAAQLRTTHAGFAATPPSGRGRGSPGAQ